MGCIDTCTKGPSYPIEISGSPVSLGLSLALVLITCLFLILDKATNITEDASRDSGKELWWDITKPSMMGLSFILLFFGCIGQPNHYGGIFTILFALILGVKELMKYIKESKHPKAPKINEDIYEGAMNIFNYLTIYVLILLYKSTY